MGARRVDRGRPGCHHRRPGRREGGPAGGPPHHRRQGGHDRVRRGGHRRRWRWRPSGGGRRCWTTRSFRAGRAGRRIGGTSARRRTSSRRGRVGLLRRAGPADHRAARPGARPRMAGAGPNALYFRASIVEQLPDPFSPLFARPHRRLGDPLAARPDARLPRVEVVRADGVGLPTSTATPTTATTAARLWRMTGGVASGDAEAARLGLGALARTFAPPAYRAAVDDWRRQAAGRAYPDAELLDGCAGAARRRAPRTTPPCRRSSRSPRPARCLHRLYDAFVRRDGDRPPRRSCSAYDSSPIRAEKSL